jgi:hypothetical protein
MPPVAAVAPPLRTVGLGDVTLMVTELPAPGSVPVDQLVAVIQSELVAPVHACCAAADRGNNADNAATDALASSRRSNRVRALLDRDRRVRSGLSWRMSSDCRLIVATPMHSRMSYSSFA